MCGAKAARRRQVWHAYAVMAGELGAATIESPFEGKLEKTLRQVSQKMPFSGR
jgi:hypothetical protein